METCYTNLANAIILAAAKDHRRALRRLKKYPWDKDAESVRKDCERFFPLQLVSDAYFSGR